MNTKKYLGSFLAGALISSAATADKNWEQEAYRLQTQVDLHAPLVTNNILGSHNTYNSDAYTDG